MKFKLPVGAEEFLEFNFGGVSGRVGDEECFADGKLGEIELAAEFLRAKFARRLAAEEGESGMLAVGVFHCRALHTPSGFALSGFTPCFFSAALASFAGIFPSAASADNAAQTIIARSTSK